MTGGEIAGIIGVMVTFLLGIGSLAVSIYTAKRTARKDEITALQGTITSLQGTIESLQHENQRLFLRLTEYEGKLAHMQAMIDERDQRIDVLETSLRDATVSRSDREKRIGELESEIVVLRTRVRTLENGSGT